MRVKKSSMFIWLLAALCLGVWISGSTIHSTAAASTAYALLASALICFLFRKDNVTPALLVLAFVTGFLLLRTDFYAYTKKPLHNLKPFQLEAKAVVCKNPLIRHIPDQDKIAPDYEILTQLKILESPKTPFLEGHRLSLKLNSWHPVFIQTGDTLRINAAAKSPKASFFAYKKNSPPIEISTTAGNSVCVSSDRSFSSLAFRARRFFSTFVQKSLSVPSVPGAATTGVLTAALTGNRSYVPEQVTKGMKTTNTLHLIAISGMHMWIIFMLTAGLGRLLGLSTAANRFFCLVLLNAYAFLTGYPPSVSRAVLMISVYLFAKISGREPRAINCLGIAGVCILLYNPAALFSLGFELSFLITALIIEVKPLGALPSLHPLARMAAKILAVSVVAWAGSEIILVHMFGQVGFAGLVLNPLAALFFTFTIASSLCGCVATAVLPYGTAVFAARANHFLVDGFLGLVGKMSEINCLSINIEQVPLRNLTVLGLAGFLLLIFHAQKKRAKALRQN